MPTKMLALHKSFCYIECMSQRTAKRDHYRRVAEHLKAARQSLVKAASEARAEELKFTPSIERAVAVVEKLEEKFNRESET